MCTTEEREAIIIIIRNGSRIIAIIPYVTVLLAAAFVATNLPALLYTFTSIVYAPFHLNICVTKSPMHTNEQSKSVIPNFFFFFTTTDLNPRDFWQWTDLVSYIECTSTFTVLVGLLMYLFMHVSWFVESVGYASLMTEACLAVPQLYQNYRTHSTIGMSATMVLLWAGGDLFKTGYFVIKQVPMQFIVCGIIQVTVDLLILAQVALYPSSKVPKDRSKKKDAITASLPSSSSNAGPKELKS